MQKLFLLVVIVALVATASAQKIGAKDPIAPTVKLKSVAILPLMFREGDSESTNKTAIDAYRTSLSDVFAKLGMEQIDQGKVNGIWQRSNGQMFDPSRFDLPTPEDLVKFGKDLGVDYVVVSRCSWTIRTPWVGLGPKTKAISKVDLWIIDIAKSEFALKADAVTSDSTEKEPGWKSAVSLLVAPISVFSGGPKTPHMTRSGQLSLAKALDPWIGKQAPSKIRIGG